MYTDGYFNIAATRVCREPDIPANATTLSHIADLPDFWVSPYNIAISSLETTTSQQQAIMDFLDEPTEIDIYLQDISMTSLATSLPDHLMPMVRPMEAIFNKVNELFPRSRFRLTIKAINSQMCPLFHEDNIYFRFITTLKGKGTQWLADKDANRKNLCKGGSKPIIKEGALLQELKTGQIGFMKGKKAPSAGGLIHRSPPIDPSVDETRVIVRVDTDW